MQPCYNREERSRSHTSFNIQPYILPKWREAGATDADSQRRSQLPNHSIQ